MITAETDIQWDVR